MTFPFENLHTYQKALWLVQEIDQFTEDKKGEISRIQADQLSRAALSVPLNIAEGNGRWHVKEKKNFFWIARGSLFEIVAILQILRNKKILTESNYKTFYLDLETLAKMLTALIRSIET